MKFASDAFETQPTRLEPHLNGVKTVKYRSIENGFLDYYRVGRIPERAKMLATYEKVLQNPEKDRDSILQLRNKTFWCSTFEDYPTASQGKT